MTELESSVKELSSENARLVSIVQKKDTEIVSLVEESKLLNAGIVETATEVLVSDLQAKVEALQTRLTQVEEAHEAERTRASELRAKIAALEESESRLSDDKVLLLETRYQLELADREKLFENEKEEMQRKMRSLEASLSSKDEEKALALKKQAALIKELQRAVKEEKKRAESMEKLGHCCSEERGWHLIGESGAKSAQVYVLAVFKITFCSNLGTTCAHHTFLLMELSLRSQTTSLAPGLAPMKFDYSGPATWAFMQRLCACCNHGSGVA
ncbi:hypothetical protein TELCIR_08530 [Teladorsagia circumcincta]|uniref:Uncharacterized protein n=1 Tax=Teladorsagia circumcincta TaxID=45464 RepID=A0A2G9UHA5_TELCI|nr:hypothetical protein TELCIR_08530 [Teladorsagia circumcincta]